MIIPATQLLLYSILADNVTVYFGPPIMKFAPECEYIHTHTHTHTHYMYIKIS
jgi:hypothetical protein